MVHNAKTVTVHKSIFWLLMLCQALTVLTVPVTSTPRASFLLQSKPPTIVRGVTTNVTLTCENDPNVATIVSQVSIIRIVRLVEGGWTLVADIRDNEQSATLYENNFVVQGNITSNVPDNFLQLVWPVATSDTFGTYRCDVIGFTQNLDAVVESTPEYHLAENSATVEGLLDFIIAEKKKFDKDIEDVKSAIETQEGNINTIKDNLEKKIENLDRKVSRDYYG